MPNRFKVTGPKGGTIAKAAPAGKLGRLLPGFVRRYKRVTVSKAPTSAAPKPKLSQRQLIVQFCHWAIANTRSFHYAEIRPIPRVKKQTLPRLPVTADCSGFATMAYAFAGAKDPNGNGFDGEGFTGTLLRHLKRTTLAKLKPGDIGIFGCKSVPAGHHAVVVTAVHARTYAGVECASHGGENGPFLISAADEARYQPDGTAGIVWLTDPTLN